MVTVEGVYARDATIAPWNFDQEHRRHRIEHWPLDKVVYVRNPRNFEKPFLTVTDLPYGIERVIAPGLTGAVRPAFVHETSDGQLRMGSLTNKKSKRHGS